MASLTADAKGNCRVQFMTANGERKTIRLGAVSEKTAAICKQRIEALASSRRFGIPLANAERKRFIDRATTLRLLDTAPSLQWRLIIALSRFGGLRCPSEHLQLKWGDINWERERFWVTSPKTEHHAGREGRWVPLFPELR